MRHLQTILSYDQKYKKKWNLAGILYSSISGFLQAFPIVRVRAQIYSYDGNRSNFSPANLVAAGHGEQPGALHDPVPGLDSVAGRDRDGSLSGLDFGPKLTAGPPVHVPVRVLAHRRA